MGARAFPQQKNSVEACKGLGPNSEAAGLQSLLVSENCLNTKSADKAKLDLYSNIDIWGLEKCRRKEGNKNGYTLRLVCSTGKDQVKYKGGQRSQKRFFFISFHICLTQISINNRYRAGEMTRWILCLWPCLLTSDQFLGLPSSEERMAPENCPLTTHVPLPTRIRKRNFKFKKGKFILKVVQFKKKKRTDKTCNWTVLYQQRLVSSWSSLSCGSQYTVCLPYAQNIMKESCGLLV